MRQETVIQFDLDNRPFTPLPHTGVQKKKRTKISQITDEKDLEEFQSLTYSQLGICFPMSFLINSKVFAVINPQGSICGGFCLCPGVYSRVIQSLPAEGLINLEKINELHHSNTFEITSLWLARSERSTFSSVIFWTKVYKEIVKMRKPYFIYAYSSKKKKLGEIYSVCKPTRIFEGVTKTLPGMSEPDHEVVEIAKVLNLHIAWVTKFSFILKRILNKRSSRKRELFH